MNIFLLFAKYFLFFFNLLITICGLVLVALGTIYLVNNKDQTGGIEFFNSYLPIGGLVIAAGAIIFIISSLGCCGAIKQNICLLTTYAIILILLFVLQIVLGSLGLVLLDDPNRFSNYIQTQLNDLFKDADAAALANIDKVQETFSCCGVHNFSNSYPLDQYPASCCLRQRDPCIAPFHIGCVDAIVNYILDNVKVISYVIIGFAAAELVGAVFAYILKNNVANNSDSMTY